VDAQLDAFKFDLSEPIYMARCPFCGLELLLGVRKDNGHAALAHSSHPDPNDPTHTRHITACERFKAIAGNTDVIPRLHREGARWQLVEGSALMESLASRAPNGA
jgi:hypothetical protein